VPVNTAGGFFKIYPLWRGQMPSRLEPTAKKMTLFNFPRVLFFIIDDND
jgi:hypothetical protein